MENMHAWWVISRSCRLETLQRHWKHNQIGFSKQPLFFHKICININKYTTKIYIILSKYLYVCLLAKTFASIFFPLSNGKLPIFPHHIFSSHVSFYFLSSILLACFSHLFLYISLFIFNFSLIYIVNFHIALSWSYRSKQEGEDNNWRG